jgi:hypothetical protein
MTDRNRHDEPHDEELERLGETLRNAIPPMGQPAPRRDLWPQILQRMEGKPERPVHSPRRRWIAAVPWFDWALLGVAAVAVLFFPALIPALLYHL